MRGLPSRHTPPGQASRHECLFQSRASGPKRKQIELYGAQVVPINGSRSDVTNAVKGEADAGTAYASHAYLPINLPGYGTIAYEIFEQLGVMPGAVIVPAGQGGLLLGIARGFEAIQKKIGSGNKPRIIGVQVKSCAPLWAISTTGRDDASSMNEINSLAEGVKVRNPLRAQAVLAVVAESQGKVYVTGEEEILVGRNALARMGFYVEPTSAIVWSPLIHLMEKLPDPIVVILTGSGLKSG